MATTGVQSPPYTAADSLQVGAAIIPQRVILTKSNGSAPTTATTDYVFIADQNYKVISVKAIFSSPSTSGTADVRWAPSGTAVTSSAGTSVLTTTISLSGATATTVTGTVSSGTSIVLSQGNALGVVWGGTTTGLVGSGITIELQRQ